MSKQQNRDNGEMTEQEAQEMEQEMQKLADKWRKKLSDPQTKAQVENGSLIVNPLVIDLLNAFPPKSEK